MQLVSRQILSLDGHRSATLWTFGFYIYIGVVRHGVMGREEECLHSYRFYLSVTQLCVNNLLQVLNGCGGRGGNVLNNTLYHYNEHLKLAEIADKI